MKVIPEQLEFTGHKVILRTPNSADFPSFQKILSDPKTMEQLKYMAYLEQGGWTFDQIQERYEKYLKQQKEQECIELAIIEKETSEVIGNCGFTHVNLAHKNAEFGIILHHTHWGTGIGEESHLICLEYAFQVLKLHRIEFVTLSTNERMRAFFDRIGIKLESIRRECHYEYGEFKDDAIYALLSFQWPGVENKLKNYILRVKKGGATMALIPVSRRHRNDLTRLHGEMDDLFDSFFRGLDRPFSIENQKAKMF